MARIENTIDYPLKVNPITNDFVIGTDSEDSNKTVSFSIGDLREAISGTLYSADGTITTSRLVTFHDELNFLGSMAASKIILQNSSGPNFTVDATTIVVGTNEVGDTFQGIKYAEDFSLNFVDRSLVDKGYVDMVNGFDPTFTTLTEGQVPKSDATSKLVYGGATVDPTTGEWTFDEAINVPSGSLNIGEVLQLSEGIADLVLVDLLKDQMSFSVNADFIEEKGSLPPAYFDFGAPFTLNINTDDSQVLTDNPLTFQLVGTITPPDVRLIDKFVIRANGAMTNFRVKITDVASGLVIRYIPSKVAFEGNKDGLDLIVGDNTFFLASNDTDTAGNFHLGFTPFLIEGGQEVELEVVADAVDLLGDISGTPYLVAEAHDGPPSELVSNQSIFGIIGENNYIRLNSTYTGITGITGGLFVNYLATSTVDTVTSGSFTAGVASTSNPTVITDTSSVFAQNDLIQITDTEKNDGIYEVEDHTGTTLTIRGVGTISTVEDFTNDDFLTTVDDAIITKVNVSVIRSGSDGFWEQGRGSSTGIVYLDILKVGYGIDDVLSVGQVLTSNRLIDASTFTLDILGNVPLNGKSISRIADGLVEVFSASDIDDLATAGVITVATGANLTFDLKTDSITSSTRFVLEGTSELRFRTSLADGVYLYSGTGEMISGTSSRVSFYNVVLASTSTGTFINITGATFNIQISAIIGFDDLGAVLEGENFVIHQSQINDCGVGFDVRNMTAIDLKEVFLDLPSMSGNFVEVLPNTKKGNVLASSITGDLGSNSIFGVTPALLEGSRVTINNCIIEPGNLFNTTGGSTGTFTAVSDASIGATSITSVTDSGGVARFNFTVGPTLFINQEVIVSTFITNTSYNGTFMITTVGVGFFEISSLSFGTDETGSFLSNTVTLTDSSTTLIDGDAVVINTDMSTDYDGGGVVYNQLVNSFQINRTFTITQTGTWNTNNIDQSDPRVLASNNPGFSESKYIVTAFVNDNVTVNGAITNNVFTDMVFGTGGSALIIGSTMERWKLVDELNGTFEYFGNEPFDGLITFDFTVTSSGGTVDFRFEWKIDTGGGFVDLPDIVQALAAVGSDSQSVTKTFPLKANKGDQIKPQITRNSGTSGIITSYATVYATQ